jgi:sarcosine oxidase subunit beta
MKADGKMQAEVVVVGAGIMGCAIAYYLARAGVDVLVLEKESVAYGGSGRNGGGVRQQWRFRTELPWAIASVKIFETIDEELDIESQYYQGGNFLLAATEEELEEHRQSVEEQRAQGLLDTCILSREEVLELAPNLNPAGPFIGARYCASDGSCDSLAVTFGYARAAKRHGATIRTHTRVLGIETEGQRTVGVTIPGGQVRADTVILAAGPWSLLLARDIGLELPIVPYRHHVMVTEPLPPLIEQFVIHLDSGSWFRQTRTGHVHIGFGDPDEPPGFNQQASPIWMRKAAKRVLDLVPALAGVQIVRCWAGLYDITPDACQIVDWAPNVENLLIVAGFSGHGFALGPITGKLVSELLLEGETSMPLDDFALARFEAEDFKEASTVL